MNLPGTAGTWMGAFVKHDFDVGEHVATVIVPPRPLPGVRWAWKGEFLDAFPGTEIARLRRGMYVVHIGFSAPFGSPTDSYGATSVSTPKFDGDQAGWRPPPHVMAAARPSPSLSLSWSESPSLVPSPGAAQPVSVQGIFTV